MEQLSSLLAIVASPKRAFLAIRDRPDWILPLAVTIVLSALGSFLVIPAARHVQIASYLSQGASQSRALALALGLIEFASAISIISVPLFVLIEAAIVYAIRTALRSDARFRQIFSLVVHVQFIAIGLGSVATGALVSLRPAASYHTQADLVAAMPTAAWLAPGAPAQLSAFLTTFGPFEIWATVVLALGLVAVARFRAGAAWTSAIALLVATAAWGAVSVH